MLGVSFGVIATTPGLPGLNSDGSLASAAPSLIHKSTLPSIFGRSGSPVLATVDTFGVTRNGDPGVSRRTHGRCRV